MLLLSANKSRADRSGLLMQWRTQNRRSYQSVSRCRPFRERVGVCRISVCQEGNGHITLHLSGLVVLIFCFLRQDDSNKMFILFDFVKAVPVKGGGATKASSNAKAGASKVDATPSKGKKQKKGAESNQAKKDDTKTEDALLKPCIYKRR